MRILFSTWPRLTDDARAAQAEISGMPDADAVLSSLQMTQRLR